MQTISLKSSHKTEMIEITKQINEAVIKSGIKEGVCTIFTPHTTGSVLLFENQDPALQRDFLKELSLWAPLDKSYSHKGDNAHAHLKSAIAGASISLMVKDGQAVFGQWQGAFFAEFDGPRETREIFIKVLG